MRLPYPKSTGSTDSACAVALATVGLVYLISSTHDERCEAHSLMPVAQFNPFERIDRLILDAGDTEDAYKLWHQLSDERNHCLDGVDDELIGRVKSGIPRA